MSQLNGRDNSDTSYVDKQNAHFFASNDTEENNDMFSEQSEYKTFRDRVFEIIEAPARCAAVFAAIYGTFGFLEISWQNDMSGVPENTPFDFAAILLIVALPAVLMLFRRGVVSAGILCVVALLNVIGVSFELASGNFDYSLFAVIWHLLALGLFFRAAAFLRTERKSNRS